MFERGVLLTLKWESPLPPLALPIAEEPLLAAPSLAPPMPPPLRSFSLQEPSDETPAVAVAVAVASSGDAAPPVAQRTLFFFLMEGGR